MYYRINITFADLIVKPAAKHNRIDEIFSAIAA